MFPMDRKPSPVCIEYESRGKRVVKTFPNEHAAKRFYVSKDRAGLRPAVTTNQGKQQRTMTTKETATDEIQPTIIETPTEEIQPATKPTKKSKSTKASKNGEAKPTKKPTKAKPVKERTVSNKERVFKIWLKTPSTSIAKKCHAAVDEAIGLNTIRGWLSRWPRAKGLPGICRKDDDMMKAAKAAMKRAQAMKKEQDNAAE